ncbi:hypothetical protein JJJ17_18975 [Paracoccus caeni]|uniref:Uncharacterized protein n=1 Tax=Paracoccus caeni TaxID=657651 RepID=A0A934SMN3_9RHOB|nr:hypothetical protein [Paracoccus caeni]MBK4218017.1 hypothetical protein [Paracoccus caeni]
MIRAAAFAICCATPALATPPDIIGVTDQLFGISADSIFVLRHVFDNHGVHEQEQRDLLLVVLDRKTRAETIWPVYRARNGADYERDADLDRRYRIAPIDLDDQIDPYAKLREAEGIPIGPSWIPDGHEATIQMSGDLVTLTDEDGKRFGQDETSLHKQRLAALIRTGETLGDYGRMNGLTITDLLIGMDYWQESCAYTDGFRFERMLGSAPTAMIRASCTDGAEGQEWSLITLLPPMK